MGRSRPHPCEFLAYIQSFLPCDPVPVYGFEPVQPPLDRVYYYHSDHLGSSSYATDNNGRPVAYYDYLPFGETMVEHNQTTNFNNGYKFNAKELDEATGMSYYGARYYDSRLSVFVSVDPLAEKYRNIGGYVYTANNPINFIDPDGRKIVPSNTFLNKPYGDIHKKLMKDNKVYKSLLKKYAISNKFNYYLYTNDRKLSSGNLASSEISLGYTKKTLTNINVQTFYKDKGIDKMSEIALAKTLIHEAVHIFIAAEGNLDKDDDNHNYFASNYIDLIKEGLSEYNKMNILGYSEKQIETLSWEGNHESEAFKEYINNRVIENGSNYEIEYNNWKKEVDNIRYNDKH